MSLPLISCRGRSSVRSAAQCLALGPHETAASPQPTPALSRPEERNGEKEGAVISVSTAGCVSCFPRRQGDVCYSQRSSLCSWLCGAGQKTGPAGDPRSSPGWRSHPHSWLGSGRNVSGWGPRSWRKTRSETADFLS